jgi:hypothetical protein
MSQFGGRNSGFFTNSQTTVNCQFITCCTINQCGVEVPDSGCCATVRCGANNCASGGYSATLGGRCNTSSGLYSAIVGGFCNIACGCNSFVGGGQCNIASGCCSVVVGGRCNTANGFGTSIVGGLENIACVGSFVGGGCTNYATGASSVTVGGVGNRACCQYSTTVGGGSNTANGCFSFVGGGSCSTACGNYSSIIGGLCNTASCNYSTLSGGFRNISSHYGSFVGSGKCNTASAPYSAVVGGEVNIAQGQSSFVGGGCLNCACGNCGSISGGFKNNVSKNGSFIGGGQCNTASGYYSGILGGQCNNICNFTCAMIVGANICATQACTTFVNDLSVCSFNSCSGCSVCIGANGVLLSTSNFGSLTLQQVTTNGNTSNVGISVTAGGVSTNSLTVTSLTTGSVPFVGAAGLITQDNPNLFWDDTNNRLGIGTTTPLGILHLFVSAATTRMLLDGNAGQSKIITYRTNGLQRFGLYVNNTAESGSNVGSDFQIRAYNDAGTLLTTPLFIKRSSGNVGIGTTTDAGYKLDVNGTGRFSGNLSVLSSTYDGGAEGVKLGYDASYYNAIAATFSSAAANNKMTFVVNSGNGTRGNVMTLLGSGNVGIGTTIPLSKLDISVGNQTSLGLFSASGTSITSAGGSTGNLYQISLGYGGGTYGSSTIAGLTESSTGYNTGALIFATRALTTDSAPTERMRITSGGNVGIGTTTDAGYKLDVNGTGRFQGDITITKASAASFIANNTSASGKSFRLVSADDGTFRIQNTGVLDILTIASTGAATFSSSVGIGRTPTTNALEVNGDASKTTAGSWLANSDSTIKTEINTIDSALERINKIRLVSFKYKDEYKLLNPSIKDKFYQNVIAQEFQKIYPDYVYQSGDIFEGKNILQVDTNPMYIDAVASIQQLSILVKELSAKNEALDTQIKELQSQIKK